MCLAQGPQHSDAGEAQTRSPSVSSQALSHCAPKKQIQGRIQDFWKGGSYVQRPAVILLPAHPASFAHDFVCGMQSFYFSESQDAIVLQTCH